jgi:putative exporter of polyketide antibiotics
MQMAVKTMVLEPFSRLRMRNQTVTLKKETFEGLSEFLSSSCAGRTTNVQRVLSVRTGVRVVPALIVPFLIFTSLIEISNTRNHR